MQAMTVETLALPVLLERLERNVEAEIENQRALQELLDQQLEILLGGGAGQLAPVLESVERTMECSQRLERERHEFLAEVGEALGLEPGTVTLTRIAGLVEQGGEEWVARSKELRQVLMRIQDTNRKVSLLLRHSVLFVEDVLGALLGRPGESLSTYDGQGRMRGRTSGTLLREC